MRKLIEGIIVAIVIGFALFVCGLIMWEAVSETERNKDYIGEKIVWQDDTLTITGYNASYGHYILDNGLLMDKSYARANTLKIRPNNAQIDSVFVDDCLIEKEKESN